MFVLDNSYSMANNFNNDPVTQYDKPYKDSKIWGLYTNVSKVSRDLLTSGKDIRVGITNYSTLTVPYAKFGYKFGDKSLIKNYTAAKKLIEDFYKTEGLNEYIVDITPHLNSAGDLIVYYEKNINTQPLTKDLTSVMNSVPLMPRGGTGSVPRGNNFGNTVRNSLGKYIYEDGQTNIAAGIHQGAELLYADNPDRQKIMILVTDGIPTASFRLKNLNMNSDLSFVDNLYGYSSDSEKPYTMEIESDSDSPYIAESNQLLNYLINTDTVIFNGSGSGISGGKNASYITPEGGQNIVNNLQGTTAVRDYYAKKHPDMRIIGMLIGDTTNYGDEFTGSWQLQDYKRLYPTPLDYLESLTSGGSQNLYYSKTSDDLVKNLELIKEDLIKKTIENGTVNDPMGDQVTLLTQDGGAFNPVVPENGALDLSSGGYYLSNNQGDYVDHYNEDGMPVVFNKDGQQVTDSTLNGVTVTYENGRIQIHNLNLGAGQEITLKYRIKLNADKDGFRYNYFYQANKPTSLIPKPGEPEKPFPVPSVKYPGNRKSFVKEDSKDSSVTLAGAEFNIFREIDSTDEAGNPVKLNEYMYNGKGETVWLTKEKAEEEAYKDYVIVKLTSADGGRFSTPDMPYGTYYLEEVTPPKGYDPLEKPVAFEINESSNSDESIQHIVNNKKAAPVVFPTTGGMGIELFIFIGILIMLTAVAVWLRYRLNKKL